MATTTIRVDSETHALLAELGQSTGATLMETVRDAAEALRRQHFARQVARELGKLKEDPHAWAEYLAESEHTSVTDGIG